MIENLKLDEIEKDYLNSLKEIEVLDDINLYMDDIRKGNIELMKLLVNTYIVLVPSIVIKFVNDDLRIAYLDLIEEANLTIIEKTQEYFDKKLVDDFDTYIRNHIDNALEEFIAQEDKYLYYNEEEIKILEQFMNFYQNSLKEKGRIPTLDELKEKFENLDIEKLKSFM